MSAKYISLLPLEVFQGVAIQNLQALGIQSQHTRILYVLTQIPCCCTSLEHLAWMDLWPHCAKKVKLQSQPVAEKWLHCLRLDKLNRFRKKKVEVK